MSRLLTAALAVVFAVAFAVAFLPFLLSPMAVQAAGADASHCQAVYNEVWELRAKGRDGEANSLNNRLRNLGCLEAPISDSLCSVLDQQELLREADGNANLANVIRAQQQRFLCR